MEARGVEPRSEIRSTTASTCVARRLRSAVTGQRAAHYCTSLLGISPCVKRRDAELSRYCDTRDAASGRLHREQGAATPKSYAARARFELAVMILPSVLPGLCTWARSHSFTDPVESRSPPWTTEWNLEGSARHVKRPRQAATSAAASAANTSIHRSTAQGKLLKDNVFALRTVCYARGSRRRAKAIVDVHHGHSGRA